LGAVSEREGRAFVNDYLETEPHALTEVFKEELFQHTGGHPLFTVELLRDLQERGDLVRDARGAWVQEQTLNWSQLPPQVEGVIEAHLSRLNGGLKKTLEAASVEGEQFTLQVLARVLGIPERELLAQLNRQLDQGHRLVRPASNFQVNVQNLHSYQFRHALFQQHIYQGLPANERELLHVEVGGVLEEIYAERLEEAAPRLARHFLAGGQAERALPYLQMAGDQALQLYSHQEAAAFYRQAVEVLHAAGRLKEASRTQLKLAKAFNIAYNYSAVRDTYERVFQLQHQIQEKQQDRSGVNQTIRMALRPPRRLGYSWFPDATTSWYTYKFFSRLVDEREGVPYPDIAHSWKISEDNRRYWFYLRQNAYWSDGVQVTAHDFEYAWKLRLKTSSSQNPAERQSIDENFLCIRGAKEYYQGELQDLDQVGVRATDRFTLTVELAEPSALFLQSLFGYDFLPLPPHIVRQYGKAWFEPGNLVTNGPFMVKEWQPEKLLWLTRDPRYRGEYPGNVDEVVIHLFEDHRSAEALELYRKGEIDVVRLSIETLSVRNQYPQEYTPLVNPMVHFLGFNVSHPPFDDRRVRQAMALCLNKEFIANQIFHGEQRPALGGYLSPEMPGHSPDISLPYDLDRAQTLMAEAGFPDERTLPALKIQYHFLDKELMPYLQSQWQKIGDIRLEYKEFTRTDELLDRVREADLFVTGWFGEDGNDPYEMLENKFDIAFREWRHG